MTVNYYLKCPMCNSVTRMRSPAGYINITPVGIHCGKCNCLLKGQFISDEKKHRCDFNPINCEKIVSDKYDFYGEAAGEVLTHIICAKKSDEPLVPFISPAMLCMENMSLSTCERYIDYVCHISEIQKNWDNRLFKYNLFVSNNKELIKEHYAEAAEKWGLTLCNDYEIYSFIMYEYLYDFSLLFGHKALENMIIDMHYEMNHMNNSDIYRYIDDLKSCNILCKCREDMFFVMEQYVKIALYVMPALSYQFYTNPYAIDKNEYGMSTCSIIDIKEFYIDCFERLARYSEIIKRLDNIKYRNNYHDFGTSTSEVNYQNMSKGNKIKILDNNEFFSKLFKMNNDSNVLRNALVHGTYKYDGVNQIITYENKAGEIFNTYLLDVAAECLDLMRSSIVLQIVIYELFLKSYKKEDINIRLHPLYYKKTNRGNSCPCGSGKKYRKCCAEWVKSAQKNILDIYIPQKTNMSYSLKDLLHGV